MDPILVGLDFSPCSERALAHADRLARRWGRDLRVVHAIDEQVLRDLAAACKLPLDRIRSEAFRNAREQIHQRTEPFAAAHRGFPIVEGGHPREVLLQEVLRWEPSLLVLGAHGVEGGPEPGTVAMGCVRQAPTDVLLVQDDDSTPFGRVLCCIGLGMNSDQVVDRAAEVVTPRGKLELLHVMDPPWRKLQLWSPSPEAALTYRVQYERTLEGQLQHTLARVKALHPQLDVRTTLIEGARPSDAVLAHAAEQDPDLIVMGNRNQGLLDALLLGRTATRILRGATCAVLAVEPHREPLLGKARGSRGIAPPVS
jgi:nucleotide-binding universal stress UspA family protein